MPDRPLQRIGRTPIAQSVSCLGLQPPFWSEYQLVPQECHIFHKSGDRLRLPVILNTDQSCNIVPFALQTSLSSCIFSFSSFRQNGLQGHWCLCSFAGRVADTSPGIWRRLVGGDARQEGCSTSSWLPRSCHRDSAQARRSCASFWHRRRMLPCLDPRRTGESDGHRWTSRRDVRPPLRQHTTTRGDISLATRPRARRGGAGPSTFG